VNTRHKPFRTPQIPSTFTLCTNSAHVYQNKYFITNVFSHTSAHLRPQALCFDTLHKNARGRDGFLANSSFPDRNGEMRRTPRGKREFGEFFFFGVLVCRT